MATRSTSERQGGPRRFAPVPRVAAAAGLVAGLALLSSVTRAEAATSGPALAWLALAPEASPAPLTGATAAYDSDNKTVVLFGGLRANGALSNDTWVWNGATWTDFPGSQIQAPSPRQLAAMAFDPQAHQLILFGGEGPGGQPLGDTWAWNGASWNQPLGEDAQAPAARDGATLTSDAMGDLVLFGGTGLSAPPPASTTTTVPTTTTTSPSGGPASTVAAAADVNPTVTLSDTWRWNGSGWSHANVVGPPARSGAAAAYDGASGQTLLFGGQSTPTNTTSPHLLSDMWAWNGSEWTQWIPSTRAPAWPPARDGAVMTADPLGRGVLLSGGTTTSGVAGDTWLWSGSSWQAEGTQGLGAATTGAAAALDGTDRQVVVFGGTTAGGSFLGSTRALVAAPLAPTTGPIPTGKPAPGTSGSGAHPGRAPASVHGTAPATTRLVTAPPGPPAVVSSPSSHTVVLHPGERVHLVGSGFKPGTTVTITFHSVPTVVGTPVADASGTFATTVTVPQSAIAGTHHFEATGAGRNGPLAELLATVEVAPLPGTGHGTSTFEKVVLVVVAVAIPVATWFGLAGASRWRRRIRRPLA